MRIIRFLLFYTIKMLYPALLKKKICSAFYCDILNTMLYYMYEGESYTLPHLCVQY